MADDELMDDAPQLSDTDSSDDEPGDAPVKSLVAGRERRTTAGNRYDRSMVLEEAADAEDPDEVTLLFADNEEEEDEEFKSDAEAEDADMSSSDDDDQGPNAATDDMEGEQDLQKQAKLERAKKRKADLALTSVAGMRKKLKTDPTRPSAGSAPAKPSKKKERVTWVHDENSGRTSLRKQTIAHREETIARLKESEAQSKKLKALKAKRDREKARDAPKELTQADRLAEAARVERQNAKSLNRWEAGEKKRQEEQAAKLAALRDKKLEGGVVSWLSQKVKWTGQDITRVANKDAVESTGPKKRGRKSKAELEQIAAERAAGPTMAIGGQPTTNASTPVLTPVLDQPEPTIQVPTPETLPMPILAAAPALSPQSAISASEHTQDPFLMGIHEYANLPAESNASSSQLDTPAPQDLDGQQDAGVKEALQQERQTQPEAASNLPILSIPPLETSIPTTPNQSVSGDGSQSVVVKTDLPAPTPTILEASQLAPTPMIVELASAPEAPVIEEDSTRNLLILERFDELTSNARQDYSFFYNKKTTTRTARAVKQSQELCPITTLPVRYRDPSTGIAYANAIAYKKLQELKEHRYAWSSMLGCYIGLENGMVARGVPDGFV